MLTRNGAHPSVPVNERIAGPSAKPAETTTPKIAMIRPRCASSAAWFTHASPAIHRKLAATPSPKRNGNQTHTFGKARNSMNSTAITSIDTSISRAGPRVRISRETKGATAKIAMK